MVLHFDEPDKKLAVIKVIGLGGAGCNAVDSMFSEGLPGVEFIVANTDGQALVKTKTPYRIQLGANATNGLGSGGKPDVGELSAEESREDILRALEGANMVFIAAGMGGGTGTGAAPVVAEIAKSIDALTVAVVTKPFTFEGRERMKVAEAGLQRLKSKVDATMVIPNDHLLQVAGDKATLISSFEIANKVLLQAVRSITDLITVPGTINVDFADINSIIGNTGGAVIGFGSAKGDNRAEQAFRSASSSSLLEKNEIKGARRVLLNITGSPDLTLKEVSEISQMVYDACHEDAQVRIGTVIDNDAGDEIKVTIIATGFDGVNWPTSTEYYSKQSVISSPPQVELEESEEMASVAVEEEPEPEEIEPENEFDEDGQMNLIAHIHNQEKVVPSYDESESDEQSDSNLKTPQNSTRNDYDTPAYLRKRTRPII